MATHRKLALCLAALLTVSTSFATPALSSGKGVELTPTTLEKEVNFKLGGGKITVRTIDAVTRTDLIPAETKTYKAGIHNISAPTLQGLTPHVDTIRTTVIPGATEEITYIYNGLGNITVNAKNIDTGAVIGTVDYQRLGGTHQISAPTEGEISSLKGFTLQDLGARELLVYPRRSHTVDFFFKIVAIPAPVIPAPAPVITLPTKIETRSITGTVMNNKNQPMGNIRLEIHKEDSDKTFIDYTDDAGFFEFAKIPLGAYTLYIADPKISDAKIELKSIKINTLTTGETRTIKGNERVTKSLSTGATAIEAAKLSTKEKDQNVKIVIDPLLRGTIVVKYVTTSGKSLGEERFEKMPIGEHQIKAKDIKGYKLISSPTMTVNLTESIIETEAVVIVEYQYHPVVIDEVEAPIIPAIPPEPKEPIPWFLPILLLPLLLLRPKTLKLTSVMHRNEINGTVLKKRTYRVPYKLDKNRPGNGTINVTKAYLGGISDDLWTIDFTPLRRKLQKNPILFALNVDTKQVALDYEPIDRMASIYDMQVIAPITDDQAVQETTKILVDWTLTKGDQNKPSDRLQQILNQVGADIVLATQSALPLNDAIKIVEMLFGDDQKEREGTVQFMRKTEIDRLAGDIVNASVSLETLEPTKEAIEALRNAIIERKSN